jgi:hypothetical protein
MNAEDACDSAKRTADFEPAFVACVVTKSFRAARA